ncbi:F-box domain-containing protein [Mycena venus]|uniref:F-box domain-containing protein n=1 Tax=Mycena venus TaxID=2733690 RepID=A0A8H6X391_9AGAR|nr:F-box domain-containing protein [Mycena venus]
MAGKCRDYDAPDRINSGRLRLFTPASSFHPRAFGSMPNTSLNNLPQEILSEILTLLDGRTLIQSCPLVCWLWKDTIDTSAELRLSIELWADGMVAGDLGASTPVERLKALYERRRAWLTLDWASRESFPVEASSRAYELVDGVFAQQTIGVNSESFSALWLPSARDSSARVTSIGDLDMDPRDFVLDPTQDLVAFVSEHPEDVAHIECRTLTTLQPHPLAAAPILSFSVINFAAGYLLVDLADDVISLFFDQHVILLNWRVGQVIVDVDCSPLMFSPFSFSLLTPRSYILGYGGQAGKIEIWSFEASHHNEPIHMATLQLPPHVESHYLATQVHSGPFRANPAARRPFSKSNESRLCVISVDFGDLVVHHRHLRKYLSPWNSDGGMIVPWDEWGPLHSRLLPPMPHRWFRYVHGERIVLPPDPEDLLILQILDFSASASSPRQGSDPESLSPAPHVTTELHTEPSTVFDDLLVGKSVTTSLPYRKISRRVDEEYVLFLIDEEQIIGVNDLESLMTVYTF